MFMEYSETKVSSISLYPNSFILSFLQSLGYALEPNKRLVKSKLPGNSKKRKIKGNTICNLCKNSIVMSVGVTPIVIFQCSHQFHRNCLSGKQKCPLCMKLNFDAIREEMELERQMRSKNQRGRGNRRSRAV